MVNHKTPFLLIFISIIPLQIAKSLKPISSGDAYNIKGEIINFRGGSSCNISLAWLKPPIHLSMAFHGHNSACQRVQFPTPSTNYRKNFTTSMVDLLTLSELINSPQFQSVQRSELKCFFLKDRVGDLAITVILYPNTSERKKMKLDLLDLQREATGMSPQDVLCVQRVCELPKITTTVKPTILTKIESNNSQVLAARLTSASLWNRDYKRQIVIYRVACALLGFLAIAFGLIALVLRLQYRKRHSHLEKIGKLHSNSALGYTTETMQSPSLYHINGKLSFPPSSQMIVQDPNGHFPGETNSVNNLMMSNSSMSVCENHGGSGTYVSYPMTSMANGAYTDGNGLVTLVPVMNRPSVFTNRSMMVQSSNGTNSPASSLIDNKLGVSRNGSLTRQNGNSYNKRNMMVSKSTCGTSQGYSAIPTEIATANYISHHLPSIENSFGRSLGNNETVVHQFPSDIQRSGTPREHSLNGDQEGSINTLHSSNCLTTIPLVNAGHAPNNTSLIKANGHIVVNN